MAETSVFRIRSKDVLDGICCEMVHLNLPHFHELLQNSFHVTEKNLSGSFMESSLHLNHCAKALYKMSMQ